MDLYFYYIPITVGNEGAFNVSRVRPRRARIVSRRENIVRAGHGSANGRARASTVLLIRGV